MWTYALRGGQASDDNTLANAASCRRRGDAVPRRREARATSDARPAARCI
jgi:hypothetical protein